MSYKYSCYILIRSIRENGMQPIFIWMVLLIIAICILLAATYISFAGIS